MVTPLQRRGVRLILTFADAEAGSVRFAPAREGGVVLFEPSDHHRARDPMELYLLGPRVVDVALHAGGDAAVIRNHDDPGTALEAFPSQSEAERALFGRKVVEEVAVVVAGRFRVVPLENRVAGVHPHVFPVPLKLRGRLPADLGTDEGPFP